MKTTQQERELIRYDAERGLACMPGQPSVGWLLKLLDDADRCADFEAMSSASPETVRAMLERCAELKAENERLRDGIETLLSYGPEHDNDPITSVDPGDLRALLDGGGE
jgi:hypothetical protein